MRERVMKGWRVHSAQELYPYVSKWASSPLECFIVVTVSNAGRVIAVHGIAEGTQGAVAVPVRKVMLPVLQDKADLFYAVHNHPNGALAPSADDNILTEAIRAAAGALSVRLCDHVIVTRDGYWSYKEHGSVP